MSPEEKEARVRGRFVNLEGLEYAEEHDDITVGFETQEGESFVTMKPYPRTLTRGQSVIGLRRLFLPLLLWDEASH